MGGAVPLSWPCVPLPASSPHVTAGVLDLPDPLLMHCLLDQPRTVHCGAVVALHRYPGQPRSDGAPAGRL